jgi:subtilisin
MTRCLSILFLFSSVAFAEPPKWKVPPGEKVLETVRVEQLDGESRDWGVDNLNIPESWKRTTGKGQVVAVLDTGVSRTHRDLRNQILSAQDYTNSPSGADDKNGHGTWCAGSIVAEDNGWGMIGAAPGAKVRVYKVLGDDGSGSVAGIAKAIRDAADQPDVSVISMSLGGDAPDTVIPPAIKYARSKGKIIICAAGNEGPAEGTVGFPGGYDGVITVAAHDQNNKIAGFSSRGPRVFVSGPGVNTRSTWPGEGDGKFATISGTSMATPRIAAVALLWVASHPEIAVVDRPARFEADLRAACPRPNGRTTSSGYGKPDAAKLTPEPIPEVSPPSLLPNTVTITEASLTAEERARLRKTGVESFSFTIGMPSTRPAGAPIEAKTSADPAEKVIEGRVYTWRNFPGVGWGWVEKGIK